MNIDDIRNRLLYKAAEHFVTLAAERDPGPVDPFVAELLSELLTEAAGPEAAAAAPKVARAAAPAKRIADEQIKTLLKSHGFKLVHPATMDMIRLFLAAPSKVFPAAKIFQRLKLNPGAGSGFDRIRTLNERGLLQKVKKAHYQLAPNVAP
jgi:hypothetical protein